MRPTLNPVQTPADVAVVLPTILRPSLLKAARSVFSQNFLGRIHLLIGVDVHRGDEGILDVIQAECPPHVTLTVLDPGYSTSVRHGGVFANAYGGSLRTVLSYLANAPAIAYLDDNDWWGANHLTLLKTAMADTQWAWSGRWLVHPETAWPICRDEWDSVGPGKGINAERFGGFVQPSGLMVDARACHFLMPLWSLAAFADGGGEDRLIFDHLLKNHPGAGTGQFTSYCTLSVDSLSHDHHKQQFLARGLGWIYQEDAIALLNDLVRHAQDLIDGEKPDQALAIIERILSINPYDAVALQMLADLHRRQGNGEKAVSILAQALEIDDDHPSWIAQLADWLGDMGRDQDEHRVRATLTRRFSRQV